MTRKPATGRQYGTNWMLVSSKFYPANKQPTT